MNGAVPFLLACLAVGAGCAIGRGGEPWGGVLLIALGFLILLDSIAVRR